MGSSVDPAGTILTRENRSGNVLCSHAIAAASALLRALFSDM